MSSRIKSISLAITIICLVIFSALIIMPFGMSFANYFKQDIGVTTPFDATIMRNNNYSYNTKIYSDDKGLINKENNSLENSLIKNSSSYNDLVSKSVEVNTYMLKNLTLDKIFNNVSEEDNYNVHMISVTDYNNVREQQGLGTITLTNNEFALNINNPENESLLNLKNNLTLDINNYNLKYSNTYFNVYYYNSNGTSPNTTTIIVPDNVVSNLYPIQTYLNVYYVNSNNEYDNNFVHDVFNYNGTSADKVLLDSKLVIDGEKVALNVVFSFIAIYLGIMLLISAGAILALQQISETSSNKQRFSTLKRLGVNEKDLKKAIFIEVLIFFIMPLFLALLNFIIIYNVSCGMILELSKVGLFKNILILANINPPCSP